MNFYDLFRIVPIKTVFEHATENDLNTKVTKCNPRHTEC